tara:strand:+ start:1008 stop:1412 length:405 start_codon:yes stop_codon:yes gene_type:complete
MYEIFTTEEVFEDGSANIACNLLHQALIDNFDATTIASHFFLTGAAAKMIQNDPVEQVKVISFGTDDDAIFSFCETSISQSLGAQGAVRFIDQLQIVYSPTIFIEIWLLLAPGALVTTQGIVMQDKANIPPYIL